MIFVLTSDVDFVSDDFLELAYRPMKGLPFTIFMTGKSDFLKLALKENPMWEAEPHPNFCSASTHGSSLAEVFATIEHFSGEKIGFRCHKYYSSNDIEEEFASRGFSYASNICSDLSSIAPFYDRCGILQIPIFFEDGGYLKHHGVPKLVNILNKMSRHGVYVFNFHAIHLALNTCDFSAIRHLKDSMLPSEYSSLSAKAIPAFRNSGYGVSDFLKDLLAYAQEQNVEFMNLKQYYEKCKTTCI